MTSSEVATVTLSAMTEMNASRWDYTSRYLRDVFGAEDDHLSTLSDRAREAGLPEIAISPDVGRLLLLLTSMTRGRFAVEVGTLGGYSAMWIARGLRPGGRLLTIEANLGHAAFAEREFAAAGLDERVEVRAGLGLEVLAELARDRAAGSVDLLFMDAVKTEYPAYFDVARELIAPGGLVIADNVLGTSSWWIDEEAHPDRIAVDALNRRLAADPAFEAVAVPMREGLLIARRHG